MRCMKSSRLPKRERFGTNWEVEELDSAVFCAHQPYLNLLRPLLEPLLSLGLMLEFLCKLALGIIALSIVCHFLRPVIRFL